MYKSKKIKFIVYILSSLFLSIMTIICINVYKKMKERVVIDGKKILYENQNELGKSAED